jgi:hypothetical protein
MNLFVLDKDPKLAAQYNCDSHVIKIILEAAQLLSFPYMRKDKFDGTGPYKSVFKHHPVTKWVTLSRENYLWTYEHAKYLMEEKKFRFGGDHRSMQVIEWCRVNMQMINFEQDKLTPFATAMPDECKEPNDPVKSYHHYYNMRKRHLAKWTRRGKPYFWYDLPVDVQRNLDQTLDETYSVNVIRVPNTKDKYAFTVKDLRNAHIIANVHNIKDANMTLDT